MSKPAATPSRQSAAITIDTVTTDPGTTDAVTTNALPAVRTHLPEFAPAPTRKAHAGWTAARQRIFIDHLAAHASVRDAAAAAGMSEQSAYRLRIRPGAESFAKAWDLAICLAAEGLLAVAVDRAIHGTTRQYWRGGALIAQQVAPSDRLLMWVTDRLIRRAAHYKVEPSCIERYTRSLAEHPSCTD